MLCQHLAINRHSYLFSLLGSATWSLSLDSFQWWVKSVPRRKSGCLCSRSLSWEEELILTLIQRTGALYMTWNIALACKPWQQFKSSIWGWTPFYCIECLFSQASGQGQPLGFHIARLAMVSNTFLTSEKVSLWTLRCIKNAKSQDILWWNWSAPQDGCQFEPASENYRPPRHQGDIDLSRSWPQCMYSVILRATHVHMILSTTQTWQRSQQLAPEIAASEYPQLSLISEVDFIPGLPSGSGSGWFIRTRR